MYRVSRNGGESVVLPIPLVRPSLLARTHLRRPNPQAHVSLGSRPHLQRGYNKNHLCGVGGSRRPLRENPTEPHLVKTEHRSPRNNTSLSAGCPTVARRVVAAFVG
jgi:hypothetical protein